MENGIPMVALKGSVMIDGSVLEGIQKVDWNGSYLVDAKVLEELIEKSQKYEALERKCGTLEASSSHLANVIRAGVLGAGASSVLESDALKEQLQEAQEEIRSLKQELAEAMKEPADADFSALHKQMQQRSLEVRRAKSHKCTAIALSQAIQGLWGCQITGVLAERGFACSATTVSRVLSVLEAGDKERLRGIMAEHPEEFEDITNDDFEQWFAKRYKKAKRTADKRAANRMNEWNE